MGQMSDFCESSSNSSLQIQVWHDFCAAKIFISGIVLITEVWHDFQVWHQFQHLKSGMIFVPPKFSSLASFLITEVWHDFLAGFLRGQKFKSGIVLTMLVSVRLNERKKWDYRDLKMPLISGMRSLSDTTMT